MGPEPSELRIGNMPPSWDGISKPLRLYHEELLNWKDFTSLQPRRQAPAVIIRLTGEPQRLALTIPRDDRVKEDGLSKIIEKFKKVYWSTEEQDLYYFYKQLTKFRRKDASSAQEYLSGFTSRAEKIKGIKDINIPPKLLAMMMIDYAELSDEQENNLFRACGGDLSPVKVSRAIKMVLKNSKEESNSPAYMTHEKSGTKNFYKQQKKFCKYCKKRGHEIGDCWKLQKKNEKNFSSSNSGSVAGKWKFPVFALNNSFLVNPIVDSAAWTSLIGEETLKSYCRILKIHNLEKAEPIEKDHRFGYYGENVKTICSVYIPLPIQNHEVVVRVDLLPGAHPFLLGGSTQERMKGILDYDKKVLTMQLGSKTVPIKLIRPDQHYLIPLEGNNPSYITTSTENDIDFKKLHVNTGHSNFDNMKKLLEHAGLWSSSCSDPIRSIIDECEACLRSGTPVPAPVVDINHIEPDFNAEVELDVVYFHGKPFLHTECKKTKLSSIIKLEKRDAVTMWNAFVLSWVFSTAHGPPRVLQGDPEFDNATFRERSMQWGIDLRTTAAKAKWQQGIIERGNGVLRAIFNRIDKDRPNAPLNMKVAHATFSKNIMFGSRKGSSYEMIYRRNFPIAGCTAALPQSLKDSFIRSIARRKIGVALRSRSRKFPNFKENEYIYFYRKSYGGFVGPAKVINVSNEGNMKVGFQGKLFSVSKDMAKKTHQPLEYWIEEQWQGRFPGLQSKI